MGSLGVPVPPKTPRLPWAKIVLAFGIINFALSVIPPILGTDLSPESFFFGFVSAVIYFPVLPLPILLLSTVVAGLGWRRLGPGALGAAVAISGLTTSTLIVWVVTRRLLDPLTYTWVAVAVLSGLATWHLRRRWEPAGSERR